MFHILAIFASMILLSSSYAAALHLEYSEAQTITPVSKEFQVPDLELDEPPVKADNENEPQFGEEEPFVKDGGESQVEGGDELDLQGDDESTSEENETESEEQTKVTTPKKEVGGGLNIGNVTQQTLEPAYKIKITFDAIRVKSIPSQAKCAEWDLGVYVQGKLVK
jgi:hypothetical protein